MKSQEKIVIVGYGYVGKAAYNLFKDHYDVYVYDPALKNRFKVVDRETIELNSEWPEDGFKECKLAVVCVPTPTVQGGNECDISIVEDVVAKLNSELILIKSTVTPGTTKMLREKYGKRVVFSPEYIGESSYWSPYPFDKNMKEMPYVVLGGEKKDTSAIVDVLLPILGPKKTYAQTDSTTAELAKYMENTFFAMKVTYCNEMYEVCQVAGVDYNEVREIWAMDPRVEKMHTMVLKGKRGYAGKCLPKDSKALLSFARYNGVEPMLITAMVQENEKFLEMNNTNVA